MLRRLASILRRFAFKCGFIAGALACKVKQKLKNDGEFGGQDNGEGPKGRRCAGERETARSERQYGGERLKVLRGVMRFLARQRGYFLWGGVVLMGIFLVLLIGLTSEPVGYRPNPGLSNSREVSSYLTHKLGPDFHNNIQLDEPFAVLVEQDGLNDIVSRWTWPVYFDNVQFDLPMVSITDENVSLMGTVKYGFVPVVATISIHPEIVEDGKLLVNLYEVRAGKVNITPLIKRVARKAVAKNLSEKKHEVWRKFSESILNNDPFEPVFPAGSERKIRLTEIELAEGEMTLHFVPAD